ncbi:hypothetical protein TNCV_2008061 [Trichonephila clavipes]|nr:hypothetical protein TNCV_2008061 [Trichonephila clavipes]
MRRNEGRVVNTPLVFKRVLFQEKEKKDEKSRENGQKKRRKRVGERDERSPPCMEQRAQSGIGVKKTRNAGGVQNGI